MNRPTVELTASPWRFPEPEIHHLRNGLTVWHFPVAGQHVAAFELVVPASLTMEPRELEGVGTVALHGIDESTLSHPDIAELLDLSGAALHASAHLMATRLGGAAPSRRLGEVLPLFTEVLREPGYLEEDVALHVEAQVAAYRTRRSSPASAARWALRAGLYGLDQRHGRPLAGSPETLERLTRSDVVAWHGQHYAPNGATLIVVGEIPDLDLSPLEEWTGHAERAARTEPATGPGRVLIVDVPDAVQATINLAVRSIPRTDPRWAPARLAGHIMAGGFASRLNLELRERLGYTYGVNGGFVPDALASVAQVSTNTRTEVAGDALARILDGLRLREPFTGDELEDAKAYRIGVAPLANETSSDIAGQAAVLAEAGLDTSFVNEHTDALREVTVEQATETWRELVHVDDLVIAVAGNAEALQQQLQGFDPTVVELA
ncbi:M16 family metallopeptidase [Tessaracoccus oleiagri]|uniref:Predicted Zn-dependent peptidase n=1 Tax=Tessaracoccus oleiagri TaxID=686624 RepID=A0A1G9L9C3_9ACTN|nr:pitrilysin family protein [Tessaracoccus oleiagri]SDL58578.1 Predicted Zn-dependent peptidase [Tessaracoccus oleiagri]